MSNKGKQKFLDIPVFISKGQRLKNLYSWRKRLFFAFNEAKHSYQVLEKPISFKSKVNCYNDCLKEAFSLYKITPVRKEFFKKHLF